MATEEPTTVHITNTYNWPAKDLMKLVKFVNEHLIVFVGQPFDFRGSIELGDKQKHYSTIDAWSKSLSAKFDRAGFRIYSLKDESSVSINVESPENRLTMWLQAPEAEENRVQDLQKKIVQELSLQEEKVTSAQTGSRRQYYTSTPIDLQWFERLVLALRGYAQNNHVWFSGRFRIASNPQAESFHDSLDDWVRDIRTLWDAVIEIDFRLDSPPVLLSARCDLRREIVDLEARGETQEKANEVTNQTIRELQLDPVVGEPYQADRISEIYKIQWSTADFIQAVEDAVQFVFTRKHVLQKASIEETRQGKMLQDSFGDLNSFLHALKNINVERRHGSIYLYVQGPQGDDLTIDVFDDLTRVFINSTVNQQRFSEVILRFRNKKALKVEAVKKEGDGSEPQKPDKKGRLDTIIDTVVKFFPIVTLVLGFFLSPITLTAAFPKPSLHITYPYPEQDKKEVVLSNQSDVRLEWVLETEQWFSESINRNSVATIRILEDTKPTVDVRETQLPGTILHLDTGKYTIEVVTPESGVSDKVRIVIVP